MAKVKSKVRMCILEQTSYHDYEYNNTFVRMLPEFVWTEVTQEEYEVWAQFVALENMERASRGRADVSLSIYMYKDPINYIGNMTYETAKKVVEERLRKREAAERRREAQAKKAAATKEKNKKAKELEMLQKLKEKYG